MDAISNFDLAVEELDASYSVRVLASPFGEVEELVSRREVEETLHGSFAELLAILDRREGSPLLPSRASLERLGEWLFDLFFPRRIGELWRLSLGGRGDSILRLRLFLEKAPALACLPWEVLSPGGVFVAQDERISVVRYPTVPEPSRYGPATWRAPRVLFVDACPSATKPLDLDSEWQALSTAFQPHRGGRRARLERLSSASRSELSRSLDEPVRVVHFAGHGCRRAIFLHGPGASSESFSPHDWATALKRNADLRLIVLNTCDGALQRGEDGSPSLAQALLRTGFQAVIAMQFPLSDGAALVFAGAFYASLAAGATVDVAMARARRELAREHSDEWASPVLFLREISGSILPPPYSVFGDRLLGFWIASRNRARRWWPRLRRYVFTLALLLAALVVIKSEAVQERWWRALRRASEPSPDREARVPPADPTLECPAPEGTDLEFILIPPGEFQMGSRKGERLESPVHLVRITESFCFGEAEVTQSQWKAIMGDNPSRVKGDDLPVTNISWNDAHLCVARLNVLDHSRPYSLPTEAQWEYVGRLGSARRYSFGDDKAKLASFANCGGALDLRDGFRGVAPVKEFPASPWGVYGIHGNISEWVEDLFAPYPAADAVDPRGPAAGGLRVRRGGSFITSSENCSATSRFFSPPEYDHYDLGFRLVRRPVRRNPTDP